MTMAGLNHHRIPLARTADRSSNLRLGMLFLLPRLKPALHLPLRTVFEPFETNIYPLQVYVNTHGGYMAPSYIEATNIATMRASPAREWPSTGAARLDESLLHGRTGVDYPTAEALGLQFTWTSGASRRPRPERFVKLADGLSSQACLPLISISSFVLIRLP